MDNEMDVQTSKGDDSLETEVALVKSLAVAEMVKLVTLSVMTRDEPLENPTAYRLDAYSEVDR
jgi:hypothetical protein